MSKYSLDLDERSAREDVAVVELSGAERNQVARLCRELAAEGHRPDDSGTLLELTARSGDMPPRVLRAVTDARLADRTGILVIRGNEIRDAELGPTPIGWVAADTPASRPYALMALLYGAILGDAISWDTQQAGRVVTDVVPALGMESSLISSSSTRELSWHTEDAFSPHRADWVGLLCLRNPQLVPTTVSSVDAQTLPNNVKEVLGQARFRVLPDTAHGIEMRSSRLEPVAVLSERGSVVEIRVDRDFTEAIPGDSPAEQALAWLVEHLDQNLADLVLQPGDMAFLNNRVVVHGRRPFTPTYRANERWVKA